MALFRPPAPDPVKQRPRGPVNPADQHNIIGASTTIEGTLRSTGNVNIAGTVEGNVEVDGRTVLMAGGTVDGEVTSTSAEIAGRVTGRVDVREQLVLKGSAVIEGDIHTGALIVEDGAAFNGRCVMKTGAKETPALDRVDVQTPKDAASKTDRSIARAA